MSRHKHKVASSRHCEIPGCDSREDQYAARGLCAKHYQRRRRHGATDVVFARGPLPADGRRRRVPAA